MTRIFWASLIMLFYTYFGYPMYAYFRGKYFRYPVSKDIGYKPSISVIISAYNEEAFIEGKIKNLLESDYPKEKMEILVGSDGSTDSTAAILSRMASDKVKVYAFEERRGKPSILRDLMAHAYGEIAVFCDVRQVFDSKAIGHLAANFADEKVGCVSGELIFDANADNGVSEGVGIYWHYEKMIRSGESAVHSMVGATGAIYAIRKHLYAAMPSNTILDDVYTPLVIARQGYRCIWDVDAKAYDNAASTPQDEYRRKVRTLAGNYQIFGMFIDLLIPFRHPVSIPLISHKLLRVIAPFFMISAFVSNLFIARQEYYAFFLICQMVFYILAIVGCMTYREDNKRLIARTASTIYVFCFMNFAALAGLYRYIFGRQKVAWEK